jgi:catechol 2,3-dioxygenase-like lactoylglutathione lyase family enzyme
VNGRKGKGDGGQGALRQNRMIRIRELDHVVLRVVDLQGMLRFYCDVLGCRVEKRQDALGLVQLRAGRSMIDLVPVDGPIGRAGGAAPGAGGRNMDHLCLRVDPFDADAIRAHLQAHGIAAGAVKPRYGAEGMGPSIYISDPEGNTVELKGPPDGGQPPPIASTGESP